MNIMYPIGKNSKWGDYWELKMSLRSVEKFVDMNRPFERICIVGHKPDWIKGIDHIPFEDKYVFKDANMIAKILRACYEIKGEFIRMSDDMIFLKPFKKAHYYSGSLKVGESTWHKTAFDTMDLLKSEGSPTLNFDAHVPQILNSKEYVDIMLGCPFAQGDNGILVNSYYFNTAKLKYNILAANINRFKKPQDSYVLDADYLNFNDDGLTDELKAEIEKLFPEKSSYER